MWKRFRMWEQADTGAAGQVYSWLLDAPFLCRGRIPPGWKWTPGKPHGCFVTNDHTLALATADAFRLPIRSNGTHAALNAPMAQEEVSCDS